MKSQRPQTIEGTFQHLIYSPPGNIEGVLLQVNGRDLQIVFEAFQPEVFERFAELEVGASVVVEAMAQKPSPKGKAVHAVYDLVEIVSLDGESDEEDEAPGDAVDTSYVGKVVRFNYAKHGEPNGVLLDTGDFIHVRPKGFAKLGLEVGSDVIADGDAHQLIDGSGWAVEAMTVNGIELG
ncbi:hypothetical protein BH09PSE5_BH09PSE5_08700 [soil metagenome]